MNEMKMVPAKVKVIVFHGKSAWIAEVPEYDLHTEADSPVELEFMLNDLLFTFFDVPPQYRRHIRFIPEKPKETLDINSKKSLVFQKFLAPDAFRLFAS